MSPHPVTVVIRSYRRIPQMLELLELVLQQDYPCFEVLILEQTEDREPYRAALEAARHDPRVRLLEYPPLGPAGSRNEAVRQARGEILLFIDDDDLPVRRDWISCHAANFDDPLCAAVSGREVRSLDEDLTPNNTSRNSRQCMRYTWLKMPRARARHGRRIVGVDAVRGGNMAIRREALLRVGGYDDEPHGDEHSFDFRFALARRPGEYFVFDPAPVFLRRLDVPGGQDRRSEAPDAVLRKELSYSHRVVRRYFPGRFYACYPAYLWLGFQRAYNHLKTFGAATSPASRAWALLKVYPRTLRAVWADALTTRFRPIPGGSA